MPEDFGIGEVALGWWAVGALGTWYYGKKTADAINSQMHNSQTPAQQQSAAQQGAQQGLSSSSTTNNCPTCGNPKCKDLRDDIHRKIYGQKGDGADNKGILQRQDEQINGDYGPDMKRTTSEFNKITGRFQDKVTKPWDTHANEIKKLQDSIKGLLNEYKDNKCYDDPDAKLNHDAVDRVLDKGFNPSGDQWKGNK